MAMPMEVQRSTALVSAPPGARNAISASSGTIIRSSKSRIETTLCPPTVVVSPRSSRSCMTIAVDESTKPEAPTKAVNGGRPMTMPVSVRSAAQPATCKRPSPNMARRSPHRRDGCISSPMMKRNITTPSSATCRIACGSLKRPRPNGPITRPAVR